MKKEKEVKKKQNKTWQVKFFMRLSLNFILLLTLRQLSSSSQYLFIILMNIWKLLFLHLLYVQHEMKIGREFFFFCINFLLLQFLLLILLYCWFISFILTLLLCYLFSCSTSQITSYYVCLYTVGNEIENFFFLCSPFNLCKCVFNSISIW